jgi:phage host-nuclease inhibitor protein Gam
MSIKDTLNERLEAENTTDTNDPWQINDLDTAAWASRKLATLHKEAKEIQEWKQRETQRIENAAHPEETRLNKQIQFFESHLSDYLRRLIEDGRRTKSLQLPGGKVSIRARQPKLSIPYQDQLEQWAKRNAPEIINTIEEINMSRLKARLEYANEGIVIDKTTGEILPITWYIDSDKATFTPENEE